MKNQRELSYAEIYSLPVEGFSSLLINALPISFRAISKLLAQGIKTLEELLNSSPQQIRKAIEDEQVYNEISNFIYNFVFKDFSVTGTMESSIANKEITYPLKKEEFSEAETVSKENIDISENSSDVVDEGSNIEADQTISENNDFSITYAEKFGVDTSAYGAIQLTELPFSARALNLFGRSGLHTASDLLSMSIDKIIKVKGIGKTTIENIDEVLSSLREKDFEGMQGYSATKQVYCPTIQAHVEDIVTGDFSFERTCEFSEGEAQVLKNIKEAYSVLGEELVFDCYLNPEKVSPIMTLFDGCAIEYERIQTIRQLIDSIPRERRVQRVDSYVKAFVLDDEDRERLLSFYKSNSDAIDSINFGVSFDNMAKYALLKKFLSWCTFDLYAEINELFEKLYSNERYRIVVQSRAAHKTLEQVGSVLGVTRERVRQIEIKLKRVFARLQSRIRIISKISALGNGDPVLTPVEIEKYSAENTNALLYLLRTYGSSNYTYDQQLDVFIVGADSLKERAVAYVEALPDIINKGQIPEIIAAAEEEEDIPADILGKAIYDTYKLTGDVYHRNRLSLASIYTTILREHYPDGISAYDTEEISHFRELVVQSYGDVKMPEADRALTARIAGICILCGRGKYKLKQEQYIPKSLANRIYAYIDEIDSSVFLINTLFNAFEEELLEAGVDNRYYLQGILRELYGDRFFFRRDYISKDNFITSIYSEIVDYIRNARFTVSKEQIQKAFPGITDIVINFATSDPSILNYFGEYIHSSKLVISIEEKGYLRQVVSKLVSDGRVHHGREIHDAIFAEKPEILTRNAALYPFSTFSVLECLFSEDFQFSRPYFARKNVEISRPTEGLHDLIYSTDEIMIADISEFMRENHFQVQSMLEYVNSCNDEYFLKDRYNLISIERTGINQEIAFATEELIIEELVGTKPIRELSCFSALPRINCEWTEWLIYSTLNKWSTRLAVAPSYHQLKFAIPLVAPVGKMERIEYKDVKKGKPISEVRVDDLDNIDELLADIIDDSIFEEEL